MGKVYVITNPMPLHNNSPAISLGKFIRVMSHAGYAPEVIGARMPRDGLPGVSDAITIKSYRYGGKGIFKLISFIFLQIKMFFSLLFKLRRDDVVYFWIADKMIGAFTAARFRKAETNYFVYGRVFGENIEGFSVKLIKHMMNKASYICAESASVFDQWHPSDELLRDCISLFVPERDIVPVPFNERHMKVAMFCRLCEGKHIDDSIKAFSMIHEKFPEYELRIIGGGLLEDDANALIKDLKAEDYIRITGWLDPESAAKELSVCRVLLFPTDAEGVPGSVLEAMSLGVPALASPAGGIPDFVINGENGVILSSADAETIAKELEEILSSGKLEEMSYAAFETIKNDFSIEAAADNFRNVRKKHNH